MNYTREQAEEVLKDYNSHFGLKVYLTDRDNLFLDHKFPNKVSGWYRNKAIGNEKYLMYFDFKNNNAYGFHVSGSWYDKTDIISTSEHDYLATPQEVKQRLIQEAKSRGFVEGVKYRCLIHPEDTFVFDGCYIADLSPEEFALGTDLIFNNGKWAEIIEQPETELTRTIKKAEEIADKLE